MKNVDSITLTDGTVIARGTRVIWCPDHAKADLSHADCRTGTVSSFLDGRIFVRFDEDVENVGWDFAQAKHCHSWNLWETPKREARRGLWERVKEWV